jgi:hypothetical protein
MSVPNPVRRTVRLAAGALSLGAAAATLGAVPATAAQITRAPVTVTIQAEGTDLSGTVSSSRLVCKADRTVIVFKQIGTRGGGDDIRFASDTTDNSGGTWVWSTGNTGTEGKFYAKVKRTAQCKADTSPTIVAVHND